MKSKNFLIGPPPQRIGDTFADVAHRWREWLRLDREELGETPREDSRYRALLGLIELDAKMLAWAGRHVRGKAGRAA